MPWVDKKTRHRCRMVAPADAAKQAEAGSTYRCDDGCGQLFVLKHEQRDGWYWEKIGLPSPDHMRGRS